MIYPIRSIVAGISAVDKPDPVLASALDVVERTGATLHLVHAFQLPGLVWDPFTQTGLMDASQLDDYTRAIQTRLEAQVRAVTSDEGIHIEVVAGPPATMILAAAVRESADLILVGATRRGTFPRAILGTTAQRVLREAPVPVLVVRDRLSLHLDRVLLTTDLSEFSAAIHEAGLDVIETLFGEQTPELRSLHVVYQGGDLPFPLQQDLVQEATAKSLSRFITQRRVRVRPVEPAIRYGDPSREIVAEAADWRAELLVVGTHGRRAPARWFLGSVAEASIRRAVTNVLVIPARLEEQRTLPVRMQDAPYATALSG
jgi:nucleotide-binding universal stress UspA family protein